MKNSNSMSKVEEFLKFKRSQVSLTSTLRSSKPDKDIQKRKQEELQQLRDKIAHKQGELSAYQKEYEKLTQHVHEAIYHLKTEQDSIEQEIESIHLQRNQQASMSKDSNQRIQDLKEQIAFNLADRMERAKLFKQEEDQFTKRIEDERNKSKDLENKVQESEKWIWQLNQMEEKDPTKGFIDVNGLKNEIGLLKIAGTNIVKEQAAELKRFKKEVQDIKKLIKEGVEKTQQRTKAWSKKLEAVLQGKKQIKDILPESFYTQKWSEKPQEEIENQYKNELAAISQIYDAQIRKELGQILIPCSIKSTPIVIRQQSFERYPVAQFEQELLKVDQETKRLQSEIQQKETQTELFKSHIEKYDKEIDNLKLEIELKKRKK